MFEDQQNNTPPNKTAGQPANTPPEDMFAATDGTAEQKPIPRPAPAMQSAAQAGRPAQPQDALARPQAQSGLGPPSALTQGKLKLAVPGAGAVIPAGQTSGTGSFPFKKLIGILIAGVIVVGGASAGVWYWQERNTTPPAEQETASLEQNEQTAGPVPGAPNGQEQAAPAAAGQTDEPQEGSALENFQERSIQNTLDPFQTAPRAAIDTDQDGLTDEREFELGTNPRLVDSDNDGLSDWEEVNVFNTDPLNRDTDGDSYLDGEEVQNGYNPNGPGKLLDFERARAETSE